MAEVKQHLVARLAELARSNALVRQNLGMAAEKKDALGAGDSADHHNMIGVGDKVGELPMEELIMEQKMAIEAETELSEMSDGKAGGMTVGADGAGVSADADRDNHEDPARRG